MILPPSNIQQMRDQDTRDKQRAGKNVVEGEGGDIAEQWEEIKVTHPIFPIRFFHPFRVVFSTLSPSLSFPWLAPIFFRQFESGDHVHLFPGPATVDLQQYTFMPWHKAHLPSPNVLCRIA
jgi:hypothetical protein